jgi:hypothetical protein
MAKTVSETGTVRLRLICVTPPPQTFENAPAEFGLQDKAQVLHPGQVQPDGSIRYDFDVQVHRSPETLVVDHTDFDELASFVYGFVKQNTDSHDSSKLLWWTTSTGSVVEATVERIGYS